MMKMKSVSNFSFIERCLFGYKGGRARLIALREELERLQRGMSVKAQQYDDPAISTTGEHGDPVFNFVAYKDKLEREIAELESYVLPIDRLCADMIEGTRDNPMSAYVPLKLMLEKRYFGKCPKESLEMSEWIYRKTRRELVLLVSIYMAL